MSSDSHLSSLKAKHEALSAQIEKLQQSVSTDDLAVVKLKQEKLRLKDEIERLSRG
ncbi:MAG: YdcH family protein [Roseivivax sp.]|nr:YdcH family protein [Roseivivax sp.]